MAFRLLTVCKSQTLLCYMPSHSFLANKFNPTSTYKQRTNQVLETHSVKSLPNENLERKFDH